MKSVKIIILVLCIVASGCSLLKDTEDAVLVYGGVSYRPVLNWSMAEDEPYTLQKATWQGDEHTVRVYGDPKQRFILDEYFLLFFHREDDILPEIGETQRIQRIEIVYSEVEKKDALIMGESTISDFTRLMDQPYQAEMFAKNSPFNTTIAAIDVYFLEYPAYYSAASVVEAGNGTTGIVMSNWSDTETVSHRDYIPIPPDSSVKSYFL